MAILARRHRGKRSRDHDAERHGLRGIPPAAWIGGSVALLVVLALLTLTSAPPALDPPSARQHLEEAIAHREAGDRDAAVIGLKNALQQNPNLGPAREMLGELYLELGEGASAQKEFLAARDLGMDSDRFRVLSSRARLLQRRFDQVLKDLDGAAESVEVEMIKGRALVGLGRLDEAAAAFRRASELGPGDIRPLISLADALVAAGQTEEAEARVDRALQLDPASEQALVLKGELRRLRGFPEEALTYFDRALENGGVTPRIGRISVLVDLGRDAAARSELERLKAQIEGNPMVHYLDAVVLAREREYREAQSALLEIEPFVNRFGPALLLRATLHYVRNEFEQTRIDLARLERLMPGALPALKLRAAAMIKQGRLTEASRLLEANRARAPEDPQILFLLGNVQLLLENYQAATEAFEEALAVSPGGLGSVMNLAFGQLRLEGGDGAASAGSAAGQAEKDFLNLQFLRGLAHLQQKEFELAEAIGRDLYFSHSESPLGPYLMGSAKLGLENFQAAREALLMIAERFPGFVPAQISLARLDLAERRTEVAYRRANDILQHAPGNVDALLLLAEISLDAERWQDARGWVEKAVAAAPSSLKPRAAMISLLLEAGDIEEARDFVQQVATDFPADARTLSLQADLELQDGNTAGAVAFLGQLAELQPGNPSHRYRLATLLRREGDLVAAKQQLQSVIDRDPNEIEAHLRLIDLVLAEGKAENALFLVERLARAIPDSHLPHLMRGNIHRRFGRLEAAIEAYEAGWRQDPNREIAKALYHARSAQDWPKEEPFEALHDWLGKSPEDDDFRMFLADELMSARRFAPAIEEYTALLAKRPQNPILLNNLAWLFLLTDDARALEFAEQAVAAAPSEPAIMDTLGWILTVQGRIERGEEILRTAVELAPDDPDIAYHYAVALTKSGQRERAKSVLERAFLRSQGFDSEPAARALWAELRQN